MTKPVDDEGTSRDRLPLRWLVILVIASAAGIAVASGGTALMIATSISVAAALHAMTTAT